VCGVLWKDGAGETQPDVCCRLSWAGRVGQAVPGHDSMLLTDLPQTGKVTTVTRLASALRPNRSSISSPIAEHPQVATRKGPLHPDTARQGQRLSGPGL
jgi:hypothetical protein